MIRSIRVSSVLLVSAAAAALLSACGTEKISVASTSPYHAGAVLFSQRCSGCHTLSYAGTHGSAANVRTAMPNNGPNFNVRCERPITRVLYAIANGGFSGAVMPQNIVTGQDARNVAEFVSEYAGRGAPKSLGQVPCQSQPVGTLPTPGQLATASSAVGGAGAQTAVGQGTGPSKKPAGKSGTNSGTNAGSQVKTGVQPGAGTPKAVATTTTTKTK